MRTLGEWVRQKPLAREDALGWIVRLAKGVLVLHELEAPHGRITAAAVEASAPAARSRAVLLEADQLEKDFHYYSIDRIKLAGASKPDDVWALGVLLYHLVTGGYPFPGDSRRKVGERIQWRPASPISVYGAEFDDVQRLLDRLFKPDEGLRLTSAKLLLDALLSMQPSLGALPPLEPGVAVGDGIAPARSHVAVAARPLSSPAPGVLSPPAIKPRQIFVPEAAELVADPTSHVDSAPIVVAPAAQRPRRHGTRGLLWLLVGTLGLAAAVIYAARSGKTERPATSADAAREPPPSGEPPPPPAQATSTPPAPAATPPPPPSDEANACVRSLFSEDALSREESSFTFVCEGENPRAVADQLRAAVVRGKPAPGAITRSMRLWSQLGWYRMAFAAAARSRCCSAPPRFKSTLGGAPCQFDDALNELGRESERGSEETFRRALAHYQTTIACLAAAPTAGVYGHDAPADEGQVATFRIVIQHLRESRE